MNTAEHKSSLRKHYRVLRSRLSPEQRADAEFKMSNRLSLLLDSFSITTVASYRAFSTEASLQSFHDKTHLQLVYPKVDGTHLQFFKVNSSEDLEVSSWGVEEPKAIEENFVPLEQVEAVIVPGLAFDRNCQRLGYGQGYYDRALSVWNGLRIGAAFQLQVSNDFLKIETHDLPMNYLVTEEMILRPLVH